MKRPLTLFSLVVSTLLVSSSVGFADQYTIDPDHSKVTFKVKHLGISSVEGKFVKFNGTFDFDKDNLSNSKTEAKIEATSISTEQTKRDDHLRSAEFLDATKFPEIEFKSTKIEGSNADNFKIIGNLTIRGVTLPVTLNTTFGGTVKDPWGNDRAAFSASTVLNRKDFGLTWNKILETGAFVVGDDVKVELEVEGIKKKA